MIFILLLALAGSNDPLERRANVFSDPSGWGIVSVKPTTDLARWSKFEDGMNNCPVCMDAAERRGLFKTYQRFWLDGVHHWFAFALDIPYELGIIFDPETKLEAVSISGTDTTVVRSEVLVFPVGWSPLPQHAERTNKEESVYVKSFYSTPTSNDYEWAKLRSEWDGVPRFYIIGYARFQDPPSHDQDLLWRVIGATSYPVRR